jgi:hypothetical protein
MRTNLRFLPPAATLLGLILASGCSRNEKLLAVQASPTPVVPAAVAPAVAAVPTTVGVGPIAGVSYADQASAAWV